MLNNKPLKEALKALDDIMIFFEESESDWEIISAAIDLVYERLLDDEGEVPR